MTLPSNSAIALYLYWRAARNGFTRVLISHDALKKYFKKSKIHSARIEEFAKTLRPVFPHHFLHKEDLELRSSPAGLKNCLVLCFKEGDDPSIKAKWLRFKSIPNENAIRKKLGVLASSE